MQNDLKIMETMTTTYIIITEHCMCSCSVMKILTNVEEAVIDS